MAVFFAIGIPGHDRHQHRWQRRCGRDVRTAHGAVRDGPARRHRGHHRPVGTDRDGTSGPSPGGVLARRGRRRRRSRRGCTHSWPRGPTSRKCAIRAVRACGWPARRAADDQARWHRFSRHRCRVCPRSTLIRRFFPLDHFQGFSGVLANRCRRRLRACLEILVHDHGSDRAWAVAVAVTVVTLMALFLVVVTPGKHDTVSADITDPVIATAGDIACAPGRCQDRTVASRPAPAMS